MTKIIEKIQLVDENDTYELWVADVPGVELICYAVINKKFDVAEMSTSILANARKFLIMLDEWEKNPNKDEDVVRDLPDFGPEIVQ